MRNVLAGWALAALIGCGQTPCEEAAELELSCDAALSESDSVDIDLPECADDSTEACVANCALENEDVYCRIRARTAEASVIQGYLSCLDVCADPTAIDA